MKKTNRKLTTIINFILDKSGSMEECKEGTIAGFNRYVKNLKRKRGNVLFSLTLFDTHLTHKYSLVPIKDVELLSEKNYIPSGNTALWDASVKATEMAYERTKGMIEDKPAIITVVLTDWMRTFVGRIASCASCGATSPISHIRTKG